MDEKELCAKIHEIYPQIGECGVDVDVGYNEDKHAWVVHLRKGGQELTTYLEPPDARACMEGKECVSLGLQVGQLVDNIKML